MASPRLSFGRVANGRVTDSPSRHAREGLKLDTLMRCPGANGEIPRVTLSAGAFAKLRPPSTRTPPIGRLWRSDVTAAPQPPSRQVGRIEQWMGILEDGQRSPRRQSKERVGVAQRIQDELAQRIPADKAIQDRWRDVIRHVARKMASVTSPAEIQEVRAAEWDAFAQKIVVKWLALRQAGAIPVVIIKVIWRESVATVRDIYHTYPSPVPLRALFRLGSRELAPRLYAAYQRVLALAESDPRAEVRKKAAALASAAVHKGIQTVEAAEQYIRDAIAAYVEVMQLVTQDRKKSIRSNSGAFGKMVIALNIIGADRGRAFFQDRRAVYLEVVKRARRHSSPDIRRNALTIANAFIKTGIKVVTTGDTPFQAVNDVLTDMDMAFKKIRELAKFHLQLKRIIPTIICTAARHLVRGASKGKKFYGGYHEAYDHVLQAAMTDPNPMISPLAIRMARVAGERGVKGKQSAQLFYTRYRNAVLLVYQLAKGDGDPIIQSAANRFAEIAADRGVVNREKAISFFQQLRDGFLEVRALELERLGSDHPDRLEEADFFALRTINFRRNAKIGETYTMVRRVYDRVAELAKDYGHPQIIEASHTIASVILDSPKKRGDIDTAFQSLADRYVAVYDRAYRGEDARGVAGTMAQRSLRFLELDDAIGLADEMIIAYRTVCDRVLADKVSAIREQAEIFGSEAISSGILGEREAISFVTDVRNAVLGATFYLSDHPGRLSGKEERDLVKAVIRGSVRGELAGRAFAEQWVN